MFSRRRERDAAALVALAGVLARSPSLPGTGEFGALYGFVSSLSPADFTRVLSDPYAHFWIRIAFELTQAALHGGSVPRAAEALAREQHGSDVRSLLSFHLEQFKRLALGAALVAGVKLELQTPLVAGPAVALPAVGAAIEALGPIAIGGVADGRVLDAMGGVLPLVACPVARCEGVALPLQAHGYSVPGMGWAPPAARSDLAFQASMRDLVERGLVLVARHAPGCFAQIPVLLRWIAVNPTVEEFGDNFASYSELPGAIALLGIKHPHVIATATVHELHHNRLFCLEEFEPLLEGDRLGTQDDAGFYSPWRDDPRPLRGLLHAVYVYVPEGRFWLDVLTRAAHGDPLRSLASDRCARISLQLELGVRQLERHARFTPRGEATFLRLAGDAREVAGAIRSLVNPALPQATRFDPEGHLLAYRSESDGRPLSSLRFVAEHIQRWDVERQIPVAWLEELHLV